MLKSTEKEICEYYNNIWSPTIKLIGRDKNLLLGFHYGLYEKGIKTWKEAALNMNDYIGRILKLDNNKSLNVLDCGCGVGSTSFYLAKKYTNINFTGITLSPVEIKLAEKYQKESQVKNTKFIQGSYLDTEFPYFYFDRIFALESFCYSIDKKRFIDKMTRILKKGGQLVILDGFRTKKTLSPSMTTTYNSFFDRRKIPNLISIDFLKSYLEEIGYKDIIIQDITSKGMFRNFIQKDFLYYTCKYVNNYFIRFFRNKKLRDNDDLDYIMSSLVPEFLLGMFKIIRYYSVSATRKD
jgi:ubiquinone/menaquinone biosynthesis C-methylase UbiE